MNTSWQRKLQDWLTSAFAPIRRAWGNLSPTDQRALRLGGVVLLILVVSGSVFLRIEDYFAREQRIVLKEQQLLQLRRGGVGVSALRVGPTDATELGQSLRQAVGESFFAIEFLQPINQGWQLEVTEAPLREIIELERELVQRGIRVARYRLERGTEPELVSGQLEWYVSTL